MAKDQRGEKMVMCQEKGEESDNKKSIIEYYVCPLRKIFMQCHSAHEYPNWSNLKTVTYVSLISLKFYNWQVMEKLEHDMENINSSNNIA